MTARLVAKRAAQGTSLLLMLPWGLACGLGRFPGIFTLCTHVVALFPGKIGNLLRGSFYKLTLRECSIDTNIGFGTFFVHPDSSLGSYVSIGSYCVIGPASIGRGTMIASLVHITGGRMQHVRSQDGQLTPTVHGRTVIGEDCWIGASAIVMGDVGPGTTIGAGAVVVNDIPGGVVAVGNPARVVRTAAAS